MVVVEIIVSILTIIFGVYALFKWKFSYWRSRNVPYIEPRIPFGNSESPFNRTQHSAIINLQQYKNFKSRGCKNGGVYASLRPSLFLIDIELIKHVMSNDFQYFTDRGLYCNDKDDPLSAHLFNLEGQKWRNLRASLTPTFTSGKIKAMFATLVACGDPLYTTVQEMCKNQTPLDIKDVSARFTTDVIGSCAFGLDCNSFTEPNSDFRKFGKLAFRFGSKLHAFKALIAFVRPSLAKRLGISLTNPDAERFFLRLVDDTVRYRKLNNIVRNDFMQLVMDVKNKDSDGKGLSLGEIAAQAFVFFLAGFETSSTTITFCLYELARNLEIQKKVRDEINNVLLKHRGTLTYEAIVDMKYLNSVIDETLRKYPPLGTLLRVCIQDYQIPDSDTIVEKGTRVIIPVYALHHDSEYFPDPEKFDPERFNDENKPNIRPFTYMPFGEGPRICIGLRFGLLQTKVGLVTLLRSFEYTLNSQTKLPIKFNPTNFTLSAEGNIWLDIKQI